MGENCWIDLLTKAMRKGDALNIYLLKKDKPKEGVVVAIDNSGIWFDLDTGGTRPERLAIDLIENATFLSPQELIKKKQVLSESMKAVEKKLGEALSLIKGLH